jgi:hypothetical protein
MKRVRPHPCDSLDRWPGKGDALAAQSDAFFAQGDALRPQSDAFARKVTLLGKFPPDRVRCVNTHVRRPGD